MRKLAALALFLVASVLVAAPPDPLVRAKKRLEAVNEAKPDPAMKGKAYHYDRVDGVPVFRFYDEADRVAEVKRLEAKIKEETALRSDMKKK